MRKVMCFGTFDILHLGHLNYFKQAKKLGDYLIVVVARDKNTEKAGKIVLFSEQERLEMVKNILLVDEAVLGNKEDSFRVILEKKPAMICLGYDHQISEEELKEKLAQRGFYPEIRRMTAYQVDKYKSSKIRK
ncbi:MAG: adenylyltransferase/cytidyltransferase family protein [Candidatus Woesearchaeota archaeon]